MGFDLRPDRPGRNCRPRLDRAKDHRDVVESRLRHQVDGKEKLVEAGGKSCDGSRYSEPTDGRTNPSSVGSEFLIPRRRSTHTEVRLVAGRESKWCKSC